MNTRVEMSASEFDDQYQAKPFWDTGHPQKAYVDRFIAAPPQSPVLDIGCGSGDLAIFVAGLGCDVLGLDFAPTAIAQAISKAHAVGSSASFIVHDIFSQPGLDRSFKTVLDCCFYHTLSHSSRLKYEQCLQNLLDPNGLIYMLCNADQFAIGPRAVTKQDLEHVFTTGWSILSVEPCVMEIALVPAGQGLPGIFACLKLNAA
jgi:2-polyprenyl-3-methyl-5-hydroxy-6-metoxy-1,4-benzoquinol methylase